MTRFNHIPYTWDLRVNKYRISSTFWFTASFKGGAVDTIWRWVRKSIRSHIIKIWLFLGSGGNCTTVKGKISIWFRLYLFSRTFQEINCCWIIDWIILIFISLTFLVSKATLEPWSVSESHFSISSLWCHKCHIKESDISLGGQTRTLCLSHIASE